MSGRQKSGKNAGSADRAVIDIGSNTVRLVVYGGARRVPTVLLNEKVTARLGRDLSETGEMPEKAMQQALASLRRFAAILPDLGVSDVLTVATAAVREAQNGAAFLEEVAKIGLSPRLLSGEEEAEASARGVIAAFPGAHGVVADLGGGSLELISISQAQTHHGVSLPLGTLRLPQLRRGGGTGFKKSVHKSLAGVGWAANHPGPLYLVGGTWRAFASYAMETLDSPLTDPHGLTLEVEQAERVAKRIARTSTDVLAAMPRISATCSAALPDAAELLRVMVQELAPDALVFSSWGLREGLLFQRMGPVTRWQDPLLAGVMEFAQSCGTSPSRAATMAAWTAGISHDSSEQSERLRLAAISLSLVASRVEPNLRSQHALDWAMHKRWVGLSTSGRGQIGAALAAFCGTARIPAVLERIADRELLAEAFGWGLAIRLAYRLGAGSRVSLLTSAIRIEGGKLVLWIDESREHLVADCVRKDLSNLAQWLGLDDLVRVGPQLLAQPDAVGDR